MNCGSEYMVAHQWYLERKYLVYLNCFLVKKITQLPLTLPLSCLLFLQATLCDVSSNCHHHSSLLLHVHNLWKELTIVNINFVICSHNNKRKFSYQHRWSNSFSFNWPLETTQCNFLLGIWFLPHTSFLVGIQFKSSDCLSYWLKPN